MVQLRGVAFPHSFRARGSYAANIQADTDLYAFSSHDRDAMPEMRRADAAGFDRATRRQLQPADLSLCALRLRRELFEGDVDRRYAAPKPAGHACAGKAPVEKALVEGFRERLFAGHLRGCRVENPGSRRSIGPVRRRLTAGQNLI
jgi:hypothetical protein